MRRLRQIIRFLDDADTLGWNFARAGLRPWSRNEAFQITVPGFGEITVRGAESDIDTVRNIFAKGSYAVPSPAAQEQLLARMNAIADEGGVPLIVDAGGNIGAASIWFAKQFPRAKVLAVEPDPANFALLKRNCEGRPAIQPVEAAIGSEPGRVAMEVHGLADGMRTVRSENGVALMTMDQLIALVPGAVPFITKIDIEGFEADLFARNTDWIDRFDALMIELHDWMMPGQGSSANVQREMGRRTGLELFQTGENLIYFRG